jgi:hypothetical protein
MTTDGPPSDCTCSHLFRGVWVHEVQQVDPRCPKHGVGTEWWERNVE